MGKLKNMALSPAESKIYYGPDSSSKKGPKYPYGLRLSFDDGELRKLGIDVSEMKSGSEVALRAVAVVQNISMMDEGGKKAQGLTLQITRLAVDDDGKDWETLWTREASRREK